MDIDSLTIGQAKEISRLVGAGAELKKSHSFQVGQCYLIRTVTMMYTGRVTAITDLDIVLEDSAWIADSGRYHDALAKGTLSEVEPYPDGNGVMIASIVDFAPWDHPLPREQK